MADEPEGAPASSRPPVAPASSRPPHQETPDEPEAAEPSPVPASGAGEGMEVGHGGLPIFLVVAFVLILCFAAVSWKAWFGY